MIMELLRFKGDILHPDGRKLDAWSFTVLREHQAPNLRDAAAPPLNSNPDLTQVLRVLKVCQNINGKLDDMSTQHIIDVACAVFEHGCVVAGDRVSQMLLCVATSKAMLDEVNRCGTDQQLQFVCSLYRLFVRKNISTGFGHFVKHNILIAIHELHALLQPRPGDAERTTLHTQLHELIQQAVPNDGKLRKWDELLTEGAGLPRFIERLWNFAGAKVEGAWRWPTSWQKSAWLVGLLAALHGTSYLHVNMYAGCSRAAPAPPPAAVHNPLLQAWQQPMQFGYWPPGGGMQPPPAATGTMSKAAPPTASTAGFPAAGRANDAPTVTPKAPIDRSKSRSGGRQAGKSKRSQGRNGARSLSRSRHRGKESKRGRSRSRSRKRSRTKKRGGKVRSRSRNKKRPRSASSSPHRSRKKSSTRTQNKKAKGEGKKKKKEKLLKGSKVALTFEDAKQLTLVECIEEIVLELESTVKDLKVDHSLVAGEGHNYVEYTKGPAAKLRKSWFLLHGKSFQLVDGKRGQSCVLLRDKARERALERQEQRKAARKQKELSSIFDRMSKLLNSEVPCEATEAVEEDSPISEKDEDAPSSDSEIAPAPEGDVVDPLEQGLPGLDSELLAFDVEFDDLDSDEQEELGVPQVNYEAVDEIAPEEGQEGLHEGDMSATEEEEPLELQEEEEEQEQMKFEQEAELLLEEDIDIEPMEEVNLDDEEEVVEESFLEEQPEADEFAGGFFSEPEVDFEDDVHSPPPHSEEEFGGALYTDRPAAGPYVAPPQFTAPRPKPSAVKARPSSAYVAAEPAAQVDPPWHVASESSATDDPLMQWLVKLGTGCDQYFEKLMDEFDGDLEEIKLAYMPCPSHSADTRSVVDRIDKAFFESIGVKSLSHRILLAKGIERLVKGG